MVVVTFGDVYKRQGKHRSVTLANELYEKLCEDEDYGIKIEHRDIAVSYTHLMENQRFRAVLSLGNLCTA